MKKFFVVCFLLVVLFSGCAKVVLPPEAPENLRIEEDKLSVIT